MPETHREIEREIRFGSQASHNCNPLISSRKAFKSLSVVFLISSSPNVRSYDFSPPASPSPSPPTKDPPSTLPPDTTISSNENASLLRTRFARSASWNASYSSSALRLATSLSAAIPRSREEVRRGPASFTSSFIFGCGAAFFLFLFDDDGESRSGFLVCDRGGSPTPLDWAFWVSFFNRLSRSAIFASRCFSKSDSSSIFALLR